MSCKGIVLSSVLFLAVFSAFSADIDAVDAYRTDFSGLRIGGLYGQEHWRTDDWRLQSQSHRVAESGGNRYLELAAKNGCHNRIYLSPRSSGTYSADFDYEPGNGLWVAVGFKAAQAKWDDFQAAVLLPPPGTGSFSRMAGGKAVALPGALPDRAAVRQVGIDVRPSAFGGVYRVRLNSAEKPLYESDWLKFETDSRAPVAMFELRSIGWNNPAGQTSGRVDNLVLEPDPADPKIEVRSSRFGHLFRRGEPITVNATVTAGTAPVEAVAVLTVTDGYGKTCFREERKVVAASGKEVRYGVTIPADRCSGYGLYTVALNVDGEHSGAADSTFGIITASSGDVKGGADSPFGAFLYPLDGKLYPEYGSDYMRQAVTQMRDLGIRWVRCNFHWYKVEPEKGKFDWGTMGELVDELVRQNMHAFIELTNTASWAASRNRETSGSVDTGREWQCVAPRDLTDWENFCARTAEHFKGKVEVYEIWNEPGAPRDGNSHGFWRDSSANFIQVIKHGAKAVRSVDPQAKIMVSGFRTVDAGRHFENFVERVLPHVIGDIDIISFHHWGEGAWTPKTYDLKRLMKEYGRELPFWDSEGPGAGKSPDCIKDFLWTWSMGAEKVFPFIYNLPRYPDRSLVNPDYTPTPGTMTFAAMTRFLSGLKPEGQVNAGPAVRAFSFSDGKRRIVAAWSELPEGKSAVATLSGLTGGFDHYGNPLPPVKKGTYCRNSIEVGPYPCFLTLDFDGLEPHAPEIP